MKKIFTTLLLMLLLAGTAFAQRGLETRPVFQGKVVPKGQMIVTEARGGSMATYKLSYFKSIKFQVNEELAKKVAALVSADAATARSAETAKDGDFLTYALIQTKPSGKTRRYLCYQARPAGPAWVITILYLEGSATLEDLRSMFDKQ
jgi:hypothetical protein